MKNIILTMLLSASTIVVAQPQAHAPNIESVPRGWMLAPSRRQNSELWHCAGYGGSWVVGTDKSGTVNITDMDSFKHTEARVPQNLKLTAEMIGKRSVLQTSDGWLIGFDAGEFGGGLWWFSQDGGETRKLLSDNVKAIYTTRQGTLVLTGLSHLSYDDGSVYRFTDSPDKVTITWLSTLGRSPEASTLDGAGNVIVATTHSVLQVNPSGEVKRLYEPEEELVYPTSVQVDPSGVIAVGMRFFVLRVIRGDSGVYRGEWLMSKKCAAFRLANYICTCTGK